MKPIIAIVGRPNVGKSTLFNRFVREKQAIVYDFPGLTRDRIYGEGTFDEIAFTVIDTGGIVFHEADEIRKNVFDQTRFAIEEADILIFLLDGKNGLHPLDQEIAVYLKKHNKKIFFVINKIDVKEYKIHESDFFSLGTQEFYSISAEHNKNIDELFEAIFKDYPRNKAVAEIKEATPIAFIGKPNVGKSSLINKIIKKERHIVHEKPGTTRDSTSSFFTYNKKQYQLVDTAGLRKRGKTKEAIDIYSAVRTLKAIDNASIVLFVFDSSTTPSTEDAKILHYIDQAGKGLILLFNKWDLVERETNTYRVFTDKIAENYTFVEYAPILFISAETGQRVYKIFDAIEKVAENRKQKLKTSALNDFLQSITRRKHHPAIQGKNIQLKYISQIKADPPIFQIMSNYPDLITESYKRYILNLLRKSFEFSGVPLHVIFKKS